MQQLIEATLLAASIDPTKIKGKKYKLPVSKPELLFTTNHYIKP